MGENIQTESKWDKTSTHKKNCRKLCDGKRNTDCVWTSSIAGQAEGDKHCQTAQYAASLTDKMGPYTCNQAQTIHQAADNQADSHGQKKINKRA